MSNRAFARTFFASTALCGTLAATPAIAQLAPPAPVRQSIDANGVDLFLGTFNIDAPALAMGGDDTQGLAYYKFIRGSEWTDNIVAALNLSGSTMTVSLGGISDRFTKSGSTYTATEGNGATLIFNSGMNIYTYTRADGTVIRFNRNYRSFASPYFANEGRVIDITRPSGAKQTFTYSSITYCASSKPGGSGTICMVDATAYRVASVRSSTGYKLTFGYNAIDPYDPEDEGGQPDFATWSTVVAVSASNLASVSGAITSSQGFGASYIGGMSYFDVTDSLGRMTKYRMVSKEVAGVTRPGSTAEDVTITRTSGRVTGVTTPAGTTTYASSDASGVRTVTVTDPLSHATTYTFNIASERMTGMTDALGHATAWQHDAAGRITRVTQPEGNYTQLAYDARGNVTERRSVAKTPGTPADIVTSATYPSACSNVKTCNQPATTTDARGNVTDYTYDAGHGGVLTVTAPAPTTGAVRPQTRYGYSSLQAYFRVSGSSITASGEPVTRMTSISTCQTLASCAGTADETKTIVSYGPQTAGMGNNLLPVSVTQGAGDGSLTAVTAFGYDDVGNRVSVDGPLAGTADTVHTRYDAARQPVGMIAPDPDAGDSRKRAATRLTYDPKGRVTLSERGTVNGVTDTHWAAFAPAESVATSWDGADRKLTDTLQSGGTSFAVTQYSYDGHRLDCTAVRMNSATWGSLPPSACTAQTTGSAGPDRIAKKLYDNADRVTKVQSAHGTAQQADEATATWSNNGKPLTLTDAEGNRTTYEYDGHDRLTKTRYPSPTTDGVSSTTDYEQPTYDVAGNVTALRLRDGQSIALTYDNLNRVTLKNLPGSEPDVTYTYDLLGRMTGAAQPTHVLTFGHDALGRNISAEGPMGVTAIQYDLAGRRTRLTWPDTFYVTYDWNPANQLTAIRENGAASGVGVLARYIYDDLGRRTGITRGNGTTTAYTFDPVSRLASLTQNLAGTTQDLTLGFTYNPAGQIATNTRSNDAYAWGGHSNKDAAETPNGLNQVMAQGGTAVGYDPRGNLTGFGTSGYGYSSENLLNAASGGVSLAYDPAMRLYQTAGGASGMTKFVYDGQAMIAEHDVAHLLQRRFVHGPGTDEPIVWYEGSGTTDRRWLHADERGSIVAVSNGSGVATSINSYDEYGVPAAGNVGRFQYTGQTWLPEIGMYHYKARTYAPALGRFMQSDPIGYGSGMNLYGYVGGDPVNRIDPTGLLYYTYYWNGDQLIRETWTDDGYFTGTTNVTPNNGGSWSGGSYGGGSTTGGGGNGGGIPSGGGGTNTPRESVPASQNGYSYHPCPKGGVVTIGLAGDYYQPGGGSAEGGVAIDTGSGKTEFYGSVAGGAGMDIGAGLSVGYYPSGFSALQGPYTEIEVNLWVADVTLVFGEGRSLLGGKATFGPQLPGVPAPGGHVAVGSGVVSDVGADATCISNP